MNPFHARTIFFTTDAPAAMAFYAGKLGFKIDWTHDEGGRTYIFQASLHGLELIVNQTDERTADRPGRGRVFVGLDDDQASPLLEHIRLKNIDFERLAWGKPALVIRDLDRNEIFFWPPESDWTSFLGDAKAGAADLSRRT